MAVRPLAMNINEKRRLIMNEIKKARRKINRFIKMGVKGRNLSFVELRDKSKIGRYTSKQADFYLKKLQDFNSRKHQYVQLGKGKWIERTKWQKYKEAEARHNKHVQNLQKRFEKMPSPNEFLSMAELRKMTIPDNPARTKMPSPSDIHEVHRTPKNVPNERALEKLTDKYNEALTAEGKKRKVESYRRTINSMLDYVAPELSEQIDKLTDEQVRMLWVYNTYFAQDLSLWYLTVKERMEAKDTGVFRRYWEGTEKNSRKNVTEGLEWVKKQKPGMRHKKPR